MVNNRITVFTIPNDGHLNILKRLIRKYQPTYDFQLVLVDRQNTSPELGDLTGNVDTPARSQQFMNTPASQVFQRVCELLDGCVELAREFDPGLIIYDFCALEGRFTAEILKVPCWCSIPGLVGPLTDREYLTASLSSTINQDALRSIARKFNVAVRQADVEVISNSLHIPGELNILWSYPAVTPPNFMQDRRQARYEFAGYLVDGQARPTAATGPPLVYLSFGTEVMDNLWHAEEATRLGIKRCVARLAELWKARGVEVVFATQGRSVLDEYPANWTVRDKVDQQEVLSKSNVFVTHGGSNSFHEALLFKVPMVVVPFFGDQALAGRRVDELGIGIDLTEDGGTDKTTPRHLLDPGLIERIDRSVFQILADDRYRKALDELTLGPTPALAALGNEYDPDEVPTRHSEAT